MLIDIISSPWRWAAFVKFYYRFSELIISSSSGFRYVSSRSLSPSLRLLMLYSGMVYEDAEKLYAEVRKDGESLLEEAFGALFQKSLPISQGTPLNSSGGSGDLVAFKCDIFSSPRCSEDPSPRCRITPQIEGRANFCRRFRWLCVDG